MGVANLDTLKKVEKLTVDIAKKIKGASAGMHGGYGGIISINKGGFLGLGSKNIGLINIIGRQERTQKRFGEPEIIVEFRDKNFPEYNTVMSFLESEKERFKREHINLVIGEE